jgi:hypothetical protein
MAQEKAKIVLHLGWPAKTIISGSTDYSKIFSDRLENLTAPFEQEVRIILEKLLKNDDSLEEARLRLGAKKVDGIELRDDELYQLRKEKKRLLHQLSDLLDLEIMKSGSGGISVCV